MDQRNHLLGGGGKSLQSFNLIVTELDLYVKQEDSTQEHNTLHSDLAFSYQ